MTLLFGLLGIGFLTIVMACGSLAIGALLLLVNVFTKKFLHKDILEDHPSDFRTP